MTNTEFIRHEDVELDRLTEETFRVPAEKPFRFLDLAFVIGFVAAFMGLVFLLAK